MPLAGHLVEVPHTLPHQVPCRHIAGVPRDREARLALEKLGLDRRDHAFCNLVLDREHVGHRNVIAFRPKVRAIPSVDQLRRDAQPLPRMAHVPVQRIARAEQIGGLPGIDVCVAQREGRAADDDAKPAVSRERRDDVVGDAVGEILLARLFADDAEWQYRDQRPRIGCVGAFVRPSVPDTAPENR